MYARSPDCLVSSIGPTLPWSCRLADLVPDLCSHFRRARRAQYCIGKTRLGEICLASFRAPIWGSVTLWHHGGLVLSTKPASRTLAQDHLLEGVSLIRRWLLWTLWEEKLPFLDLVKLYQGRTEQWCSRQAISGSEHRNSMGNSWPLSRWKDKKG